jgi:hypothetical protein
MLIQESHQDVPTKADGKEGSMSRWQLATAECPTETDKLQGYSSFILPSQIIPMREHTAGLMGGVKLKFPSRFPGVVLFSEIYQGGPFIQLASLFQQDGLVAKSQPQYDA